jgi:hypothetical protein
MKVIKLKNIEYYPENRGRSTHLSLREFNEYVVLDLVKSMTSVKNLSLEVFNFCYYNSYYKGESTPLFSNETKEILTKYNINANQFSYYYYDIKFIEDKNNIRIGFLSNSS